MKKAHCNVFTQSLSDLRCLPAFQPSSLPDTHVDALSRLASLRLGARVTVVMRNGTLGPISSWWCDCQTPPLSIVLKPHQSVMSPGSQVVTDRESQCFSGAGRFVRGCSRCSGWRLQGGVTRQGRDPSARNNQGSIRGGAGATLSNPRLNCKVFIAHMGIRSM